MQTSEFLQQKMIEDDHKNGRQVANSYSTKRTSFNDSCKFSQA